ncbi:unnamed protein product [[Candida] boidinii]|nr:unnamed protein product [[Candida] boidinii]
MDYRRFYTTLHKKRQDLDNKDTAFIKIEQLHPFPFAQLRDAIKSYPNLTDLVWCQEEPLNMGAWAYVQPRILTTLEEAQSDLKLRYSGRDPSASVATGSKHNHLAEIEAFTDDVFQV